MRKIKWKNAPNCPSVKIALINGVLLDCVYENGQWCSYINFGAYTKVGEWFSSLEKAQEDCVQLAKQMLTDLNECLVSVMKSFDVNCEEIE